MRRGARSVIMQILPSRNSSPLGDELLAKAGLESSVGEAFSEYLQSYFQALGDVDAGKESSVQNALDINEPLAEAPYSKHTTDGITYTLDEVCFTKQELGELRQELVKAGASEASLKDFDTLAEQPDGATLAQVVTSLEGNSRPPTLSEEERTAVAALTERIDPSGSLTETVMGHIEKGQGLEAWTAISRALNGVDGLSVHKDEIAALGKALGISEAGIQKALSLFGARTDLQLSGNDFRRLMAPVQEELLSRKSGQEKLDAALDKTLRPILQKAKDRMEAERKASTHSDRSAEHSKVMIDRTVKTQANQTIEGAATGELRDMTGKDEASGKNDVADQLRDMLKADRTQAKAANVDQQTQNADRQAQNQADARQQHSGPQDQQFGWMNARDGKSRDGDLRQSKSKADPLLSKIDVRPSAVAAATFGFSPHTAQQSNAGAADPASRQMARQAASQVEQALLTSLRDGSKRLELQLDPSDLGNVTVVLTARNGEVNASIRSDRTETAEMMQRQLDMIRTNLEQQGVKVGKLEVQTHLADNNQQQQWDGLNQHNAQQEEHARREQMERLRTLRNIRNSSDISTAALLEQGMQLSMQSAGNAAQRLHIIA